MNRIVMATMFIMQVIVAFSFRNPNFADFSLFKELIAVFLNNFIKKIPFMGPEISS